MSTNDLLKLIDSEIATLKQARAALTGKIMGKIVRGRKCLQAGTAKPKKTRKMSAEARARIAAAQKKRWAAQKKSAAS